MKDAIYLKLNINIIFIFISKKNKKKLRIVYYFEISSLTSSKTLSLSKNIFKIIIIYII